MIFQENKLFLLSSKLRLSAYTHTPSGNPKLALWLSLSIPKLFSYPHKSGMFKKSGTQEKRSTSGRPRRVAPTASGQAALRSDFEGQNQSHAPLSLLFREKSHWRMLCVPKRTHKRIRGTTNFSRLFGGSGKRLKIIKSRDRCVAFYSYMRVETVYRFVSNAPNAD